MTINMMEFLLGIKKMLWNCIAVISDNLNIIKNLLNYTLYKSGFYSIVIISYFKNKIKVKWVSTIFSSHGYR